MVRTEEHQALDWKDPMSKKHKIHTHTHTHTHTRLYTHIYINAYYSEISEYQVKEAYKYYRERKCYKQRDGVNR